jgi:hypothetical protein
MTIRSELAFNGFYNTNRQKMRAWFVAAATSLAEVEAIFDQSKELIKLQNYRDDLEVERLKRLYDPHTHLQ